MMNEPVVKLINKIRERPILFLKDYSVTQFKSFLDGYCYAELETNNASSISEPLSAYGKFVAGHYGVTKSIGWDEILLLSTGSEAEALDLFWQQWDAFLIQRHQLKD